MEDNVNHPKHYCSDPSGVEAIQITRHRCFNIGNALKYLWRSGLKKDASMSDNAKEVEDLKKAIFYIQDKIKMLESEKKTNTEILKTGEALNRCNTAGYNIA
jgi:hypothetical protein